MPRALATYAAKRDFDTTDEPPPRVRRGRARGSLSFVVQKHAARRLHFDFRLELDGVLKSWAIPKGPSLSPSEKRLAVEVEDHPFDYRNFEGSIPAGEYGGGEVIVWDRGTWVPEGDAHEGLKKGHLTFRLEGEKLHGTFSLVRMRSGASRSNWLLVKADDTFAKRGPTGEITTSEPRSVLTGKTIEPRKSASQAAPAASKARGVKAQGLPRDLAAAKPALATLVSEAPAGDDWIFETKFDGYRALAIVDGGEARILSRNGLDWTDRFPKLAAELARRPVKNAVFDGEICVMDDKGHSSFQRLQEALSTGDLSHLSYFVFDLLAQDGEDLRDLPLLERKKRLAPLLRGRTSLVKPSPHVRGGGAQAFASACEHGLEGVIAKRVDAPYVGGRGRTWLKVKCEQRQELVIVGFTPPKGGRKGLGALVLGVNEGGKLRVVGKVGTGFSQRTLVDLEKRLAPLVCAKPPAEAPRRLRNVTWVTPRFVCEVRFTEWTRDGAIRHPSFLGLREDKTASDVTRERPREAASASAPETAPEPSEKSPKKASKTKSTSKIAKKGDGAKLVLRGVEITHPDRVVDAASGATKGDIARYYDSVADHLLPYIEDRPLALVRCPNGAAGRCFFQQHSKPGMGKEILSHTIDGQEVMSIRTAAGLLQLVQFGVIELHAWGARLPRADKPDWIVMDLDPDEGLPFARVVEAARAMREAFRAAGFESWAKTTGGKGLHVVVPIAPRESWSKVKTLAREVARKFATTHPELYVDTASKAARRGKIFIDYLRNGEGATAVAPLSVRARPNATVAMPVAWEQLTSVDPGAFTIATVPKLLATQRHAPNARRHSRHEKESKADSRKSRAKSPRGIARSVHRERNGNSPTAHQERGG